MTTLTEEIGQYDQEQRRLLQEAAQRDPEGYFTEERRIHDESRAQYLEILARHNRKRDAAQMS